MSFKRFAQLFIIYVLAILCSEAVVQLFSVQSIIVRLAIFIIVGYIVLTIPLTVLTLLKNKK
ncbi:hypothetical protein [Enterococcus columbae]|uniref:Uncharacterized protein n=1 Tax=Enterococcus columbae DSM 7374 = ATCC 51263 TaxID=1121865 RepID=S1NVN4_9ENTE|nr:hypothetical protein [Enterococcus columbae]EOT44928.1 hypothetical protein OMW_00114 [Enterococcus columbae DSM 7374 = ATCC 51263]EOW84221.1 hypothetical protein I568_00708 [Enterococcus columbae DSM 7374 = ATCC 51263]OJG24972.1 hypothetical protein RR47_GL002066 [Enterococcus columbae DSM 7374 = ATCC 51263]